jgi:hypothetical protein
MASGEWRVESGESLRIDDKLLWFYIVISYSSIILGSRLYTIESN